uniref:Carboxypeptidase Taq n=1 Tax=Calcidiscus leptoporus TaxID=127549 RepID=A0A7S0JK37_9EUKA|mmetsp:Transcript_847/g.1942  ORF Transcript_847/g.1942 Transcript_847/m.1942 type:complete len:546 (+) Transcript_847:111-1748(+)
MLQRLASRRLAVAAGATLAAGAGARSSVITSCDSESSYSKLKSLLREVSALSEVQSILGYDEQVFMPDGAAASRAAQKGALAKILHDKSTGSEMKEAIEGVRGREADFDDPQIRANIRDAVDSYDKEARKSSALAQREAQLASEANQAWAAARKASDFSLFAEKLTEMFELKKEVVAITRPALKDEPYDGALDEFERGMRAERLDEIFAELRAGLVPLLEAINAKKRANPSIDALHPALEYGKQWGMDAQAKLSREVAARMGYSFANGRLDVSTHPFTSPAGPRDVRITTRYSANWAEGFGATIHETGHALYEQGRNCGEEGLGLPCSQPLSMGVHESQSLLWERMVLQSKEFWQFAAPLFHERFEFTKTASPDDFYKTYNRVAPGCIRVEADECTYPLHVILRYDIERKLFRGEMAVSDVPQYWVTRMKDDLGVDVPDDAQGCLQDIHWSFGAVGYFPSYTLGAMMAVQIFNAAKADLGDAELKGQIARGEFKPLREWLRRKVHEVGSVHASPDELLMSIAGEPVSPRPFLEYLTHKYSELYEL